MEHATEKIRVTNLYKIFGGNTDRALTLVQEGRDRDEIMHEADNAVVALRDISFSVTTGEIFVIMGLSGSGKSTLLRCINRLIEPTFGSIVLDSNDITRLSPEMLRQLRQKRFGMVFQHFALLPHRTVLENVTFGLELSGTQRYEREKSGRSVLQKVGLSGWEHHPTSSLSGGMQQRVGLARALAINPEILLMDEPFSALDPLIRTDLQEELLSLHRTGGTKGGRETILFVTHDLNEAVRIGSRIAILNGEGALVQVGTPEEILLHPADAYVERFLGDIDRPSVIRVETVMNKDTATPTKESPVVATHPLKHALPHLVRTKEPLPVVDESGARIGTLFPDDAARILTADEYGPH